MMQKMMKGPRQCKHTQTHTPTRAYTHPECNYGKLQRCPSVYLSAPACQSAPPLWTTCNIPAAKVVAQFQLLPQRTEKIKYIFIFLVSLLLLLLLLLVLLLLLLLPLTVVAAFYAKINHKAAQPCSLFGSFFNVFFFFFFFWIYAHTWICIWPQQSAASKSPFTSFSSLHSLYSLLPVCQLQPFKVKHLKRHTLRMINMNATHLHLIYYSTHACTQAHTHGHYSCTIVSAFFPPYLRWIWRFDLR